MTNMPENTDDFRLLLDEKFKNLHNIMEVNYASIQTTLNSIDAQVKKTNGRVTKLEEVTNTLILKDATHSINCPQITRIKTIESEIETFKDKINKDLEEYNFFKRYPKIAIGTIAVLVVIMLLGIAEVKDYLNKPKEATKIEASK